MSGSNIIIMLSPRKVIIMNMQCNIGVSSNSIQSGVTTSGQVYQYQVLAYLKYQGIACQLPGVRYQVSGIKC